MPFTLIDPDAFVTVSINGNEVQFKRLSHGDNLQLMNLGALLMKTPSNELADQAAEIMAKYVTRIDVPVLTMPMAKIIKDLALNDFLALMGEMTKASTLSDGQIKN